VAGLKAGYAVEVGSVPGRLAVRADPETARRLFHTMLCLFPSPSTLCIRYREGRAERTLCRSSVGRPEIAEAFESLSEFILTGQRIQFIIASDTVGAELRIGGGGELHVTATDLGPFERVVEDCGLPALHRSRLPAAPRLGAGSRLGGELATLENTLERLRLTPPTH
jgi:hypothetical protein